MPEEPVSLSRIRSRLALALLVLIALGVGVWFAFRPFRGPGTLLNVSYDATREFYAEVNQAWTEADGAQVNVSHAGSTAQAEAILRGLQADVATLATAADLDALAESGFVSPDWRTRFPHGASPYTSTIIFLVRTGNPHGVRDWADLVEKPVEIVVPSPKVSGAGRWAYLAAWADALRRNGGDEAAAERFIAALYSRAPVLNAGARKVLNEFVDGGRGDVLLMWENEVRAAAEKNDSVEVVYPSTSILAEPVVAIVDRNVDRRGTRRVATGYLEFLFSPKGQEIAARHWLRPRVEQAGVSDRFPAIELFRVEEVFGGWDEAFRRHFADGGVFDRIQRFEEMKRGAF